MTSRSRFAAFAALSLLAPIVPACATPPPAPTPVQAADVFMANLRALCGKAFAGRMTTDAPQDTDMKGRAMVMHVRSCEADAVRVPFHVGEDRSRTWVLTRTPTGLRLKHDHRHADGAPDAITQYGGDTTGSGTATRQTFPVDAFSIDLFNRTGRAVSTTNVWAVEIVPGALFAYELRRENRHFRVEFDLATEVPAPPPPWGATD
jgi:hypothetical protein